MKTMKVRLNFPVEESDRPITGTLIRDFDITVNILQARIEPGCVGRLVLEMMGEEENLEKGLAYLREEHVDVKIYSQAIIWDKEACISCGACTAVCHSGALHLDENALLSFDQDRCVVCQMCVPCCPMGVLHVSDAR